MTLAPLGSVVVPMPMQPPLAAGVDEPITGQRLEHVQPARSLAAGRQTRLPEPIELQLIPKLAGQPARAPLAWVA